MSNEQNNQGDKQRMFSLEISYGGSSSSQRRHESKCKDLEKITDAID